MAVRGRAGHKNHTPTLFITHCYLPLAIFS